MKACQYDKRFLKRKDEDGNPKVPQPRVYAIQESNDVDSHVLEYFCTGNAELKEAMETIMEEMHDAKEYGSIITVTEQNWDTIYARFEEIREDISIHKEGALELLPLVQVAQALAQKYDVVVTNPPYMASSGMSEKLSGYVKNYNDITKQDLYAVFIDRCIALGENKAKIGIMTSYTWIFLSSFENARKKWLYNNSIQSLIQPEYHAFFESAYVPICTFIIIKGFLNYVGKYINLSEFYGAEIQDKKVLEAITEKYCKYLYTISTEKLKKIPGLVLAYWISDNLLRVFGNTPALSTICEPKQGLITGDNDRFLRMWYEVSSNDIAFSYSERKWYPFNKGGEFRRWYGNREYVILWENDGNKIKNFRDAKGKLKSRPQNLDYNFRHALSWSLITSGNFSVRYYDESFAFNVAGISCFPKEADIKYLCALLNCKVVGVITKMLNPTLNMNVGDVAKVPVIIEESKRKEIENLTEIAISLSKKDWDSFETSWDFQQHPLVRLRTKSKERTNNGKWQYRIEDAFFWWNNECEMQFEELKSNEEELNRIFINIYGLQDELTPEVEDKDVTVHKADLQRDIRSLISYAVGCMFGRYSLDKEGLIFAGGHMADKFSYYGGTFADTQDYQLDGKYTLGELGSKFYYITVEGKKALECWKVDADNIIPITDDEYFEDDILEKFIAFIHTVYGEKTLEENLKFIADALGGKGQPREVIRNYFLNDFYKDHCKIYQKRPIYWLFDSGKKNGFKCLIYMHRYEPDTIARIRTDYVHEQQSRYRTAIADLEHRIANAGTSERVKLNKSLKKIQEQADELHTYEEKIHHLADQMITIDLDDGVKHNYEIFKDVLAKIK